MITAKEHNNNRELHFTQITSEQILDNYYGCYYESSGELGVYSSSRIPIFAAGYVDKSTARLYQMYCEKRFPLSFFTKSTVTCSTISTILGNSPLSCVVYFSHLKIKMIPT